MPEANDDRVQRALDDMLEAASRRLRESQRRRETENWDDWVFNCPTNISERYYWDDRLGAVSSPSPPVVEEPPPPALPPLPAPICVAGYYFNHIETIRRDYLPFSPQLLQEVDRYLWPEEDPQPRLHIMEIRFWVTGASYSNIHTIITITVTKDGDYELSSAHSSFFRHLTADDYTWLEQQARRVAEAARAFPNVMRCLD